MGVQRLGLSTNATEVRMIEEHGEIEPLNVLVRGRHSSSASLRCEVAARPLLLVHLLRA